MSDKQTVVLRGKASFAKILGDPVLNFAKDGKEWVMDFVMDEATAKEMKGYGIADRVKRKDTYLEGQPYLTLKKSEFQKSGKRNDPIPVVDIFGKEWNSSSLIGNGSTVDVKIDIVNYGPGKKHGIYIRDVRVLDLVSYNKASFEPLSEDDEFFRKAVSQQADEAYPEPSEGVVDHVEDEVV